MSQPKRKPPWLKRRLPASGQTQAVSRLLNDLHLHTVCQEALCPNQGECYGRGTATFLLLGPNCSRNCAFCAVGYGPLPPDPEEPDRTAEALARMGLKFAVLTMVTRDDLEDGGADHVARTVTAIKKHCHETLVEVLISDFQGKFSSLESVLLARPEVLNHNVETVPRLYPRVRPQADYGRSLQVLKRAGEPAAGGTRPATKSGLMLGLGESRDEVLQVFDDLRESGCQALTLGQYLAPTSKHFPVARYLEPEEFDQLAAEAEKRGFAACAAGPFVRSSYQADEIYQAIGSRKKEK
ncbi:MAG: lipoyl synthase [Pseudomonadota bacterium]